MDDFAIDRVPECGDGDGRALGRQGMAMPALDVFEGTVRLVGRPPFTKHIDHQSLVHPLRKVTSSSRATTIR